MPGSSLPLRAAGTSSAGGGGLAADGLAAAFVVGPAVATSLERVVNNGKAPRLLAAWSATAAKQGEGFIIVAPWRRATKGELPAASEAGGADGAGGVEVVGVAAHLVPALLGCGAERPEAEVSEVPPLGALDTSYSLCWVADYWLPLAESVLLEVEIDSESVEPLPRAWELPGLSSLLRERLLGNQIALRSGCCIRWESPSGALLRLKPFVQLPLRESDEASAQLVGDTACPSSAWGPRDWHAWFQRQRCGLVGELTNFTLVLAAVPPSAVRGADGYSTGATVRDSIDEVLHRTINAELHPQNATIRSVAVVVGPRDGTILASLRQLEADVHVAVLSAAVLSHDAGHRRLEVDFAAARRWVLSRVRAGVRAVVVLLRPETWFGTHSSSTEGFGGMLRQILDVCQCYSRNVGRSPGVSLLSLFDAAPPKQWERLGLFDQTLWLDELLGAGPRPLSARGAVGGGGPTLEDLRGLRAAKDWFAQALRALDSSPEIGQTSLRASAPAVALHGATGTGKTVFLCALARCDNVRVLPLILSSVLSAGVGDTQAAVRELFDRALHVRPACITLDDADELFAGIAHCRSMSDLLAELVQMIDFHCSARLLFVATCSSPACLPAALACRLHAVGLEEEDPQS